MKHYAEILEFDKIINIIKTKLRLDASITQLDTINLSNNLIEIEEGLAEVDEAFSLIERFGEFPLYFKEKIDVILTRLNKGGIITSHELVIISYFLDSIKANILYLEKINSANVDAPYFTKRINVLYYHKDLNLRIKNVVNNYGEIQDEASVKLKSIRRAQRDLEKRIENKLQEILAKEKDKLSQTTISLRNNRYVLPVKNDYRNIFKGIVHDQSASKETVFMEPFIINNMTNNLILLKTEEEEEITRILSELSNLINDFYYDFMSSYHELIKLDIIFAKAKYAITIDAKKPQINNKGELDLINCYHPLLNVDKIIKNSVRLGRPYQGIIITGPNTGGKTVLLKTVGLLCLMVKASLLIPAESESKVCIYNNVFADIGDEQSIDQNLSTFSSHLSNIINIINNVDNNSLVLLDELGSGTDPVEGAALAISIFDYLIAKECHIIATSHYSELKLHAYRSEKIINASVEFNEETLMPTYKLLLGVPGMSNALQIAKRLGLNETIIAKANNYTFEKTDDINLILTKLVNESHELERKLNNVNSQITLYNEKLKDLDNEKKRLKLTEDDIIDKANKKAQALIQSLLKESQDLLDELKAKKQDVVKLPELADLTRRLRELDQQHLPLTDEEDSSILNVGDSVYLKKHGLYAIITKIHNNSRIEIQVGNAIMNAKREDLVKEKATIDRQTKTHSSSKIKVGVKDAVAANLDLRGKRYNEAEILLEKFIDSAIYANLTQISIVHGFGTGAIRELVQKKLQENPYIDTYRYGGSGEGGQGVTIAELKK